MDENDQKINSLPNGQIKALHRLVVIVVLVSIVGGAFATMNAVYQRHNPNPLNTSEVRKAGRDPMSAVRHVTVNGQKLTIPIPYFHSRVPPEGAEGDVLFTVSYPEFQPLTKWHRRQVLHYLNVRTLLMSPVGRVSVQEMHDFRKRQSDASDQIELVNGLPRYIPTNRLKDDLYPVEAGQVVTGFIYCTSSIHYPTSATHNPQCSYTTYRDGIIYNVDFDKDILSDFKEIRHQVFSIVDTFKSNK